MAKLRGHCGGTAPDTYQNLCHLLRAEAHLEVARTDVALMQEVGVKGYFYGVHRRVRWLALCTCCGSWWTAIEGVCRPFCGWSSGFWSERRAAAALAKGLCRCRLFATEAHLEVARAAPKVKKVAAFRDLDLNAPWSPSEDGVRDISHRIAMLDL